MNICCSVALLLFANSQKGLVHFFRSQFLDKTFKGLYTPNGFDLALLIPYFVVMVILAGYGIHRYVLVYMYYKNRKNRTTEPPAKFTDLPRVTIQLPIYNEQYVIDRLVESICKLDYPKDKLDIQVLDDSTDETVTVAKAVVDRYAALGHPVVYIHRTNREGLKQARCKTDWKQPRAIWSLFLTLTLFLRKTG